MLTANSFFLHGLRTRLLGRHWVIRSVMLMFVFGTLMPAWSFCWSARSHDKLDFAEICSSGGNKIELKRKQNLFNSFSRVQEKIPAHSGKHCTLCSLHLTDAGLLPSFDFGIHFHYQQIGRVHVLNRVWYSSQVSGFKLARAPPV